jgi:hypothetical protein
MQLVSVTTSDGRSLIEQLRPLSAVTVDARLIGRRGSDQVRLRLTSDLELSLIELPTASPRDLFDDRQEQNLAEEAWRGEVSKFLDLPWSWSLEAELALHRLVGGLPEGHDARVTLAASTIHSALTSVPAWELGTLLPDEPSRRVFIALDAQFDFAHLGRLTLTGPLGEFGPGTSPSAVAGEHQPDLPNLPHPGDLIGAEPEAPTATIWRSTVEHLRVAAGIAAWCELASEARPRTDHVRVIFRGLRRLSITIEAPIPDPDAVLALHSWTFAERSPDRVLAVQQVASLQNPHELLGSASDLRDSADIVYAGLRSDAVAEAVKGYRDAHASTLNTMSQASKTVQEMTKSATDRAFAALVAIGGVLIANASKALTDEVGRHLLLLVAGFLVLLAGWSLAVEGPLIGSTFKHLKSDLSRGSPLMTTEQIDRLVAMDSVTATGGRAKLVRVAIPTMYLTFAVLILALGHPSHYK